MPAHALIYLFRFFVIERKALLLAIFFLNANLKGLPSFSFCYPFKQKFIVTFNRQLLAFLRQRCGAKCLAAVARPQEGGCAPAPSSCCAARHSRFPGRCRQCGCCRSKRRQRFFPLYISEKTPKDDASEHLLPFSPSKLQVTHLLELAKVVGIAALNAIALPREVEHTRVKVRQIVVGARVLLQDTVCSKDGLDSVLCTLTR